MVVFLDSPGSVAIALEMSVFSGFSQPSSIALKCTFVRQQAIRLNLFLSNRKRRMASAEEKITQILAEKKEELAAMEDRVKLMAHEAHERRQRKREEEPGKIPKVDRHDELRVRRDIQTLTKEIEVLEARLKDGMAAP